MKRIHWSLLLLVFILDQSMAQIVPPPPQGNSVVYFVRGALGERYDTPAAMRDYAPSNYDMYTVDAPLNSLVVETLAMAMDESGSRSSVRAFCLFDSTRYFGRLNEDGYIRYECESGFHLFWSRGTHDDFIEAQLAPGKTYFIVVSEKVGEVSPDLIPVNPGNEFLISEIFEFMSAQPAREYTDEVILREERKQRKRISKSLRQYEQERMQGRLPTKLTADMYIGSM